MKYEPKIHHRRSIRLRGYDYSLPGAYYVTLCAFGKQCIFGQVIDDQMQENDCGEIVRQQWFESSQIRQNLDLDAFIVMPNHLHGILWIVGPNGIRPRVDLTPPGLSCARPRTNRVQQNSNAIRPNEPGRTPFGPTNRIPAMRPHSLAAWASGFKSAVTSRIRKLWNEPHAVVWQEDYFEHVIRDEDELFRIRNYILTNPARWKLDRENPEAGPDAEDDWPWSPDDLS
jgi:REP element-mobilizing transposase RayT